MSSVAESASRTWWRSAWFKWTVVAVVIVGLAVLSVVIWKEPKVNAAALEKARELHDQAVAKGFDVPSVEQLARTYGTDGGAAIEFAVSDITQALFALGNATTGEVNQRPILLDEVRFKVLYFEWLMLGVYRPELQAEFQKWVDQLKTEGKISGEDPPQGAAGSGESGAPDVSAVSAEHDAPGGSHEIGLVPCIAFCIGTMIGGGVFTLSGLAVDQSGPSAIIAYLIAGAVMLLSALSFVVISSRSKPGDSGYAPLGDILSPGWRFIVMWGFYLNAVTCAAWVLMSFGTYVNEYFVKFLGQTALALIAIAAMALLNLGPADLVGKAETYLVAVKVAILLVLIGYGLANIGAVQWTPVFTGGGRSLAGTTALLFTAYTGFNVVTNMAGSVRDPKRTVPRAIVISIVVSALIYVGIIIALLASGQSNFGEAGLGKAATALMGSWGGPLVALAAAISTLSAANGDILGGSELMIRLAGQGDIPPGAGRISKRGHPVFSVLLAAGIGAVLIAAASESGGQLIIALSNVTAIFAMLVVNVGAFRLALQKWPGDGVKLPGGVLIPVLGFAAAAAQLPSLGLKAVLIGAGMTLVGYVMYALRHQTWLAGDAAELKRLVHEMETPLARALRRAVHPGKAKA